MAPLPPLRQFRDYAQEFQSVLDLVVGRRRYIRPQAETQLRRAIERRAIAEFQDGHEVDLADILAIVEDVVDRLIAPNGTFEPNRVHLKSLPGKSARDEIRATLNKLEVISKKELKEAEEQSDNRMVEICSVYKISEEQLLTGLKHLDHIGPTNWRPVGARKNPVVRPWAIEKAVFRYYLSGMSLNIIPELIRKEFSGLGAKIEVPDTQEAVTNVAMSIRAIPALVIVSMLLATSACIAAAIKAFAANSIAKSLPSWKVLGGAAGKALAVLALALAALAGLATLLIWLFGRGCGADRPAVDRTADIQAVVEARDEAPEEAHSRHVKSTEFGIKSQAVSTTLAKDAATHAPETVPVTTAEIKQPRPCGPIGRIACGSEIGAPMDENTLYICVGEKYEIFEKCQSRCFSIPDGFTGCEPPPKVREHICGHRIGRDARTIYACSEERNDCTPIYQCEQNCLSTGNLVDQCDTPPTNCTGGWYCGTDFGWRPDELYACSHGSMVLSMKCNSPGCFWNSDHRVVHCGTEAYAGFRSPPRSP